MQRFRIDYVLTHHVDISAADYPDGASEAEIHDIERDNAAEFLTDVLAHGDGQIEVKVTPL